MTVRLLFIPFAAYDEAEGLKLLEAVSVDNVKAVEMILQQPRDPNFCDLGEDAWFYFVYMNCIPIPFIYGILFLHHIYLPTFS